MKKLWSSLILLGVLNFTTVYAQDFNELLNNITKAVRAVGTDLFQLEGKGKEVIKEEEEPVGEEVGKKIEEEGKEKEAAGEEETKKEELELVIPEGNYRITTLLILNDELVDGIIKSIIAQSDNFKNEIHKTFFKNYSEEIRKLLKDTQYLEAKVHASGADQNGLRRQISIQLRNILDNFLLPGADPILGFKLEVLTNTLNAKKPIEDQKTQLVFSDFKLMGKKIEGSGSATEATEYHRLSLTDPKGEGALQIKDIPATDIATLGKRFLLGDYLDVPSFKRVYVRDIALEFKLKINDQLTDPLTYSELIKYPNNDAAIDQEINNAIRVISRK